MNRISNKLRRNFTLVHKLRLLQFQAILYEKFPCLVYEEISGEMNIRNGSRGFAAALLLPERHCCAMPLPDTFREPFGFPEPRKFPSGVRQVAGREARVKQSEAAGS